MPQYSEVLLQVAFWGFILNLFNMLPVPPLDGGRVTAAISPLIGGGAVGAGWADRARHPRIHAVVRAVPDYLLRRPIWKTIVSGQRHLPYYQIPLRRHG